MTRNELEAALAQADAEGWHYVANKAPALGERVEVMHILNRSYDTDGECDAEGRWHCSNGFILPDMTFTFNPTHWRSRDSDQSPKGEDADAASSRSDASAGRDNGIASTEVSA